MGNEKVRRYGLATPRAQHMLGVWQITCEIRQKDDGLYVLASDYDALSAELATLRAENAALVADAREDIAFYEGAKAYRAMVKVTGHDEYDLASADQWLREGCGRRQQAKAAISAHRSPAPPTTDTKE